jgi:hypothetical protein
LITAQHNFCVVPLFGRPNKSANEELLKTVGRASPHVTQLGKKLGYSETVLTVEEFIETEYKRKKMKDTV